MIALASPVPAADGDLDTTFSGDGFQTLDIGGDNERFNSLVIRENGRIVCAGSQITVGDNSNLVARFLSNGDPDTSFDTDGMQVTGNAGFDEQFYAVDLLSDGRTVACGQTNVTGTDMLVHLYTTAGALDTTFSGDGIRRLDWAGKNDRCQAIAVQDDDRILVGGYALDGASVPGVGLARLNPNGSLDTTFGTGGKVQVFVQDEAEIFDIALQPDGKIVACGVTENGATKDLLLLRFLPDGSLDTTFSGDGIQIIDFGTDADYLQALVVQPNGRILATGYHDDSSNVYIALVRRFNDGSPDTGFGTNGRISTSLRTDSAGQDLVFTDSGRIVLLASNSDTGNDEDLGLVVYDENGDLDTSFDGDGMVTHDLGSSDYFSGLTIQDNGFLVAAGRDNLTNGGQGLVARVEFSDTEIDADNDGARDTVDSAPDDPTVASVPAVSGTGDISIDVSGAGGPWLAKVTPLEDDDASIDQTGKPSGATFSDGMLQYTIAGVEPGGTVDVEITFPTALDSDTDFYWAGPGGFEDFSANCAVMGDTITVTLTDGGAGDADGLANGEIIDPFGPARASSSSSGGGGCAFGLESAALPWLLVLLAPVAVLLRRRA